MLSRLLLSTSLAPFFAVCAQPNLDLVRRGVEVEKVRYA